jgi:hypothetical protein
MRPSRLVVSFVCAALAAATPLGAGATGPAAGPNLRVTNDATAGSYISADVMGGTGIYTDNTLQTCGTDRRMQNEPTIAIDPRNVLVETSGSNDYCAVETNHDAWAGFYRTTTGGTTWTDSLLPGYPLDTSPQGLASPIHQQSTNGAKAAGDPVQAWDTHGRVFFMGNNFNRGILNGRSGTARDNTGDVWVATYAPSGTSTLTDGSRYLRTVILSTNTFGEGSFNDKTGIGADTSGNPATDGNVYAAWSDFHGLAGCNEILLARSTDHGQTFSPPLKISGGICGNQGPNLAIDSGGTLYVSWFAANGGTFGQNSTSGAALVKSTDGGQTFSKARMVTTYNPFGSGAFSGNGARDCGDPPFNCPTGFTFPRFDLAMPTLTTDGTDVDMAYQVALSSGQGQIQFVRSIDGGATFTPASPINSEATGHQFFPWMTASGGVINAVYYDSAGDPDYAATRPPCNNASGHGSNCLNVTYSVSKDHGLTWSSTIVTSVATNPNYEQFGGRLVPFFGDYIMVSAVPGAIATAWTDNRNVVAAPGTTAAPNVDGDDVAGDPNAGGSCTGSTSSFTNCFDGTGGLDQNIYTAALTN